ncbi:hypothetical protein MCEMSEM23_00957 [Rhabdaerophilaceae bacterium]
MNQAADDVTIALGSAAATDAFGLDIEIDGASMVRTILAAGPGLFRAMQLPRNGLIAAGWIAGFVQRGPILTPIAMPEAGWILASLPDNTRVQHGTAVLRILLAHDGVLP